MITRIAFLADRGFLPPTLVALASALAAAGSPVEAHLVGWDLGAEGRAGADRVAARWPGHRLVHHDLPRDWIGAAKSPKRTITVTALGKLFLPRLIGGRVLYIDGDALVRSDLAPLMSLDMGGRPLGGVPDWVVARRAAQGRTDRIAHLPRVMGEASAIGYVNSGVLLYDMDAIRPDAKLTARMEDLSGAAGYPTVDQDRINEVFRGRIAALDPAWNASWGRLSAHRRNIDRAGGDRLLPQRRAAILHFHGPEKPWGPLSSKLAGKGLRATLAYRAFLARFERWFPDLGPRAGRG
ncbi:glycosyltransferase family 8 protein [Wenxinia saemankumensis]|uniref:Lipopolysaccharide biosynthesis protein, LPS:glycosyltransferase n=1 Tax=Wenxinia saemankumensis TaxID=1447782 RepID=A0A1M6C451_9RHOB|nr:glycosyltransferase [Wenxinia saemankumensis]SHI55800.1 Lipopolysaccharide biosynthesis protein, LPS:glycosyltransferase [Wenxinia saemankumensis]